MTEDGVLIKPLKGLVPPWPIKWTIAICTVRIREGLLNRLLRLLYPQIGDEMVKIAVGDGYKIVALSDKRIEIIIAGQDLPLSEKRQWCLDQAEGEYFCFIDDDDLVAENYVDAIYPLLDGVDYIGFQLQYYHNGEPWKPTFHSLKYGTHCIDADAQGFYRGVSHLNPIRTEIARQGRYYGGYGEDNRWCEQVEPVTEHYIDQIMYHYLFSESGSLTAGRD